MTVIFAVDLKILCVDFFMVFGDNVVNTNYTIQEKFDHHLPNPDAVVAVRKGHAGSETLLLENPTVLNWDAI